MGGFEFSSCDKWVKLIAMMVVGEVEVKQEHTRMGVFAKPLVSYIKNRRKDGCVALASPFLPMDGLRVGSAA